MRTDLLSRRDVSILKGAGIVMIFLHNYFHWERGMGIENEFAFSTSGFRAFLDHAFDGPLAFVRYTFAYFGHFGVQLFVLTSGYGLAISARSKRKETYLGYLVPKLIKILALLLLGAIFISLVQYIKNGRSIDIAVVVEIVLGRMSSFWNFSGSDIFRYSGPFWFFGLIVQLYVLFPF
ncbi:MAG: acyltransferase family protein, partial [Flavobacteriales bacterium]|nr:acyltransferase family protein [Flavobacteriales bacterium]